MSEIDSSIESIYNEKSLYLLNIKELRSIGRQLGVSAPASKNKQELVDCILKIIYGEVNSSLRSKYGRPSKVEYDIDECLSKIKSNYVATEKIKNYNYDDNIQDYGIKIVASKEEKYQANDNIETRFFCEENDEFYLRTKGFVNSDDDIKLTRDFVDKYNLENMDIVEIVKGKQCFNLYSINGIKIKNDAPIPLDSGVVNWGKSQDFYLSTKEEINQKINKLLDYCKDKDAKLMIFGNSNYFSDNCYFVAYSETDNGSVVYKKLMGFIDTCQKNAISGENVIVVFENKTFVDNVLCSFDEDILCRIKKHLNDVISELTDVGNICISFKLQENLWYS